MKRTDRTRIKRVPKRAHYDEETIYRILDSAFVCHLGFIHDGFPIVIPTLYGRENDMLYFHGASTSRLIDSISQGIDVCLSVAIEHGIVLARSAFHHSVNYESVVLLGNAREVTGEKERLHALKVLSDHVVPGRWDEVRGPNPKELKATRVLSLRIEEGAAKVRSGPPVDEPEDYQLDIWAGILPILRHYGDPIPDPKLGNGVVLPPSVESLLGAKE